MDVLFVYCFKSVGSYKHKLLRIESLVFLYWGINCRVLGLARLIEISVNWSIYKRKTIIDIKIQKSVTLNGYSVYLFNKNPSVFALCYFLIRPEVP